MAVLSGLTGRETAGMVMVRFCFLLVSRNVLFFWSAGGSISRTINVHGTKFFIIPHWKFPMLKPYTKAGDISFNHIVILPAT